MLTPPLRRLLVLLVAVFAVCVGCKATAAVSIKVDPDGSGTVSVTATLDAEAVAQLGGDPAAAVKTGDLKAAGWSVTGPTERGGQTVITVTKPFRSAAGLGPILDEIGGTDGVFAGWKLTSSNSFTVSSYAVRGKVHLTGSLDQFSDTEVAGALDGNATGRTPEELAAALGADPDALRLSVSVALPGELDDATGLTAKEPGSQVAVATYRLGTGDAHDVGVSVRSSATDRSAVLWILVGTALVALAIVLSLAGARQSRRRRRSAQRS